MSASQQLLTIRCFCGGGVFTHVPIFCRSIPQRNAAPCQSLWQCLRREITPLSFPLLLLTPPSPDTHSQPDTLSVFWGGGGGGCSVRGIIYTDDPTGYLFNRIILFSPLFIHFCTGKLFKFWKFRANGLREKLREQLGIQFTGFE